MTSADKEQWGGVGINAFGHTQDLSDRYGAARAARFWFSPYPIALHFIFEQGQRREESLGENRAWLPHSFGHDARP
jgi:hypothetical protein